MAEVETEEHKLRRLLYTGTPLSTISLQGGINKAGSNQDTINTIPSVGGIMKTKLLDVQTLIQPNIGTTNLALQHCLAAIKNGHADKGALFLVLSACLKIDCRQTRTAIYETIKSLIQSPQDFFEFIYYHRKIFQKKPHGMGSGMRRLISNWYLSMDPYELGLEVSRVRGRHHWEHRHLIELARVRSADPAMAAVLSYVMKGFTKTKEKFKTEDRAQPILDYLRCVRDINNCKDPQEAITLISMHSFDLELLPKQLLKEEILWEHTIPRTPLRGVLYNLRMMSSRNMLSTADSPVLEKVLNAIRSPYGLASSQLQPAEILGIISQVEAGFSLPSKGTHKQAQMMRKHGDRPHSDLTQELGKLLDSSFSNMSSLPCSVHLSVDIRQCAKNKCWGSWDLSCLRALTVTILSLVHANTNLTLSYITENRLAFIEVSTEDNMASVMHKLQSVSQTAEKLRPEKVLRWGREVKHSELVLCVTASSGLDSKDEILAELEQARADEVKVKFIYWAMASKHMEVPASDKNYPNILDIWGWSADSTRIIQAFAKDFF